jgi:hypothetical protein
MNLKQLGLAAALISFSVASYSAVSTTKATWNFGTTSDDTGVLRNNQLSGSKNGIDLSISAWASSYKGGRAYCADSDGEDQCVSRAKLRRYGDSGLGVVTQDEIRQYGRDFWGNRTNDPGTPNHSMDNNDQDYEMILLSFSEAVNISSIDTGWNYSYTSGANDRYSSNDSRTRNGAQASVLAFTGTNGLPSTPFSNRETWADILDNGWSEIESNASTNSNGDIPVGSDGIFSKHWLIGAANAISRQLGAFSSHLKIAGVTFATPSSGEPNNGTPVNAPAGIAFLMAVSAWMFTRRKR